MRPALRQLIWILFFPACLMMTSPSAALAEDLAGRSYKTFIYSDISDEASINLSFESNGSFLIDAFDGVGLYLDMENIFIAAFSAPNFNEKKDLMLVLSGMTVVDYLTGMGIAFVDNDFHDVFFLFGYAIQ